MLFELSFSLVNMMGVDHAAARNLQNSKDPSMLLTNRRSKGHAMWTLNCAGLDPLGNLADPKDTVAQIRIIRGQKRPKLGKNKR